MARQYAPNYLNTFYLSCSALIHFHSCHCCRTRPPHQLALASVTRVFPCTCTCAVICHLSKEKWCRSLITTSTPSKVHFGFTPYAFKTRLSQHIHFASICWKLREQHLNISWSLRPIYILWFHHVPVFLLTKLGIFICSSSCLLHQKPLRVALVLGHVASSANKMMKYDRGRSIWMERSYSKELRHGVLIYASKEVLAPHTFPMPTVIGLVCGG